MTKSKGRAKANPRSGTTNRLKAKRAKRVVQSKTPKSKQAVVLALLSRPNGATIAAITFETAALCSAAPSWRRHCPPGRKARPRRLDELPAMLGRKRLKSAEQAMSFRPKTQTRGPPCPVATRTSQGRTAHDAVRGNAIPGVAASARSMPLPWPGQQRRHPRRRSNCEAACRESCFGAPGAAAQGKDFARFTAWCAERDLPPSLRPRVLTRSAPSANATQELHARCGVVSLIQWRAIGQNVRSHLAGIGEHGAGVSEALAGKPARFGRLSFAPPPAFFRLRVQQREPHRGDIERASRTKPAGNRASGARRAAPRKPAERLSAARL
jgi:hypothetical protein